MFQLRKWANWNKALITAVMVVALTQTLLLSLAAASESGEYLVHTGPNGYPPFVFVHEQGDKVSYSGIVIDLLDVFEQKNPEFRRKYNQMSRARANSQIERGEFPDLMFMSKDFVSPEQQKEFLFTHPLFTSQDIVVTRKDNALEYVRPESLYGKTVAILRGYSYWEFDNLFEKGVVTSVPVDRHTQAIGMLERNRVDAYFGNIHVTPHYLNQVGAKKDLFSFSDNALSEVTYSFMIHSEKVNLYTALNTFIKKVVDDGTLQKIVDRYL